MFYPGDVSTTTALTTRALPDLGRSPDSWPATLTSGIGYDATAKALTFDGVADMVTFGPATFGAPLTLIVMARPDEVAASVHVLQFFASGTQRLSLSIDGTNGVGTVKLHEADGSTAATFATTGFPLWTAGQWSQVAFTLTSAGTGNLYLNGVPVATGFPFAGLLSETRTGYLGRGQAAGGVGSGPFFRGAISLFQASLLCPLLCFSLAKGHITQDTTRHTFAS